jgi:hypothetical protein
MRPEEFTRIGRILVWPFRPFIDYPGVSFGCAVWALVCFFSVGPYTDIAMEDSLGSGWIWVTMFICLLPVGLVILNQFLLAARNHRPRPIRRWKERRRES